MIHGETQKEREILKGEREVGKEGCREGGRKKFHGIWIESSKSRMKQARQVREVRSA